ncbi:MAG: helix-turn-helix transcriptional regulator [Anaeroplasmataceae bacterium]|nr:helix-turn-helix transcriptional regulator [Anaeroplasmataceae bacterium]
MDFAKNLKTILDKKNIKNIDLSKALKIDRSNITKYLNGQKMPNYETLEKIKNYLECSYDDLLK